MPGCVDGWVALHDRFGTLPLATLLAPAIALAEITAAGTFGDLIGETAEVEP